MPAKSEQLWDAIYHLGAEDLTDDNIPPAVIAKLLATLDIPARRGAGDDCVFVS